MKKIKDTRLIRVAEVYECIYETYRNRNILILVAGPGSDGSYMLETAQEFSKYGNSYVIVQEIFRSRYPKKPEINPKSHLDDLIIEVSEDLLNFEQENNLTNIVTAGHCLMGLISLYYGEISKNVERSFLISTPAKPLGFSFKNMMRLFYVLCKNGFFRSLKNPEVSRKAMMDYLLLSSNMYFYDKTKSRQYMQIFIDSLKDSSPEFIQAVITKGIKPCPDLSRVIPDKRKTKQGVVYIEGEFEEMAGKGDFEFLKRYLEEKGYQHISREIIPDSKHFCFMENPDFFNKTIGRYLK
jgi:pimeloyl-ACP methyl ester carboxylesterase